MHKITINLICCYKIRDGSTEIVCLVGFCRENGFGDRLELSHIFNSKRRQSLWWSSIQPWSGFSSWRAEPRYLMEFVEAICRAVTQFPSEDMSLTFLCNSCLLTKITLVKPSQHCSLKYHCEQIDPTYIAPFEPFELSISIVSQINIHPIHAISVLWTWLSTGTGPVKAGVESQT